MGVYRKRARKRSKLDLLLLRRSEEEKEGGGAEGVFVNDYSAVLFRSSPGVFHSCGFQLRRLLLVVIK